MAKTDRHSLPGYDVSDYGARQRVNRFIMERLQTGLPHAFNREKEALKKEGLDPNTLILADRIGETGIFFRLSISAPILVNENSEVNDLSKPKP